MIDIDTPLLTMEGNPWTMRNAFEGVQIFGGIGSGKTSGSGRLLASRFLKSGFGGLVMTVKPDEAAQWKAYCEEAGRSDDFILIEPYGDYKFNFLDYEINREGVGAGQSENLAMVLKTVIKSGSMGDGGKQNDRFWEDALDMLLINILDLCVMGKAHLTIDNIYGVAQSLPKSWDQKNDEAFRKRPFYQHFGHLEKEMTSGERYYPAAQLRKFESLKHYFWHAFLELSDRTRSTIEHMLWGLLFRLSRDPVYSLLCNKKSNIKPEDSINGKVIVFNLPTKLYDKIGQDAQILFKYIWQRAMERRHIQEEEGRPVFLWADEAQNFIHEHDIDYQATARSSRVCTVYLTQNLNNYYAHLAGRDGEYRVKSFLGTMGTKIFHANADIETNKYASDLFGQVFYSKKGTNVQVAGEFSSSISENTELKQAVRPEQFVSLRTGGPVNENIVDAYLHKQGPPFRWQDKSTEPPEKKSQNFLKIEFEQKK